MGRRAAVWAGAAVAATLLGALVMISIRPAPEATPIGTAVVVDPVAGSGVATAGPGPIDPGPGQASAGGLETVTAPPVHTVDDDDGDHSGHG
jgi:hypothetical protein